MCFLVYFAIYIHFCSSSSPSFSLSLFLSFSLSLCLPACLSVLPVCLCISPGSPGFASDMGSCLSNGNTLVHDDEKEEVPREAVVEQGPTEQVDGGKKKKVSFKLQEEDNVDGGTRGDPGSKVVRIRVVLTVKELKQMLESGDNLKQSSVEQLVSIMKLRGKEISEGTTDGGVDHSWRPALESIPEDGLPTIRSSNFSL